MSEQMLKNKLWEAIEATGITVEDADNNGHTFLFYTPNSVIKIPHIGTNIDEQVRRAYEVYHKDHNTDHLVKLLDKKPKKYLGHLAITMERGKHSLKTYMKNRQIDEESALEIMLHASLGLQSLHKKGIRHRDIKPSNILETQEGLWVLTDYDQSKDSAMTQSFGGTDYYRAPELEEQRVKKWTFKNDIYALGCVLYEMLNPDHVPLYYEHQHDDQGLTLYEFSMQKIDALEVSDFAKYILRKTLGKVEPEDEEELRFNNISYLVNALSTGKPIDEDSKPNPTYDSFLELHNEYMSAFEQSKKHRNGKWKTINYKTIDSLMNLHEQYLELMEHPEVIGQPGVNQLKEEANDLYERVRGRDANIMIQQMDRIEENKNVKDFEPTLQELKKLVLLWGPPFSNSRRYTLAQIEGGAKF